MDNQHSRFDFVLFFHLYSACSRCRDLHRGAACVHLPKSFAPCLVLSAPCSTTARQWNRGEAESQLVNIHGFLFLKPSLVNRSVCFPLTQVLLFPALSFVHAGRLSSLEFVTQELSSQIQVRFQTYSPHCHHPGLHLLLPSESHTQACKNIHTFLVNISRCQKKKKNNL